MKAENWNRVQRNTVLIFIEALETGRTFKFSGNVRNNGFITNLPYDATVEVPIYADREGLHPFTIGDLPIQLAAMNQSNLTVQGLAAVAAIHGDPELAFWAIAMDPLTSSVLSLKDVRKMVSEMFEAEMDMVAAVCGEKVEEKYLKLLFRREQLLFRYLPIPALAINSRFGKLGE